MTERHRPFSIVELLLESFVRAPGLGAAMVGNAAKSSWKGVAGLGLLGVYLYVVFTTGLENFQGWGMGSALAALVAGVVAVVLLLSPAIIIARVLTAAYSRLRPSLALIVMLAVPPILPVCALLNVSIGLPIGWSVVIPVVAVFVMALYVRSSLAGISTPVRVQVWLDDPTRAADLVRDCEEALADPELTPAERTAVEANLASGFTAMAQLSISDDGLPRAYEILMRSLGEMAPADAYIGAARLADAMAVKASRTGDVEGYEEALRLMLDAANVMGGQMRCIMARARLIHATHLVALSARAAEDGRPGRAARLQQEALDDLVSVFELARPRSTVHALAQVKFASLVERSSGDLDAAIALCRVALRRLRLRSRLERDFGRQVLCRLLTDRARPDNTRARRDVAEAMRLCTGLLRRPASRAEAVRRLPELMRLRGSDPMQIARAYRDGFDELSLMSGDSASDLAAEWSAWAIACAEAAEVAEAHWCWIRAVADDARRRPGRVEKERRLARFLGMAAQTGDCLIAAGRGRDAAVALDLSRAMLLTERMSRNREGITERLTSAGRADLADRWRAVQERIAEADRAAFAAHRASSRTMVIGGRRFQPRFTSSDHLALTDLERLLREISRVAGCEDVDAPPQYDDLRAAAREGPIVYLCATAQRTHALIVSDAPQPQIVELEPTIDELAAMARELADATHARELVGAMRATIPLLWTEIMEPVAARLDPGALVTLIPVGALSLLPLHVAGLMPDDDGVWRDRGPGLVYRYAPNARVLGHAQAGARSLAGRPLRVLTVDVPDAPGEAPLPCASTESAGVVARYGSSRVARPSPASRAAVLRAMDMCGIWHFACHGVHRRVDPLESSLLLSDGRLTMRSIFARPAGVRRLAVLSACRTAAPDQGLLDEVVSFPSALLQSGFAGVVCAQSDIVDLAAMLLVLRFLDELEHDDAPPRALARAQAWLRTATNGEIHADLPDAYSSPTGCSPAQLDSWSAQRNFTDPICWAPLSYSGA